MPRLRGVGDVSAIYLDAGGTSRDSLPPMNRIANASIPLRGVPVFGASNKSFNPGVTGGWWTPRSAGSRVAILRPLAHAEKPVAAEPPDSQALDFLAVNRGELWRAEKPSKNCALRIARARLAARRGGA